jgi:hypothetical protein
MDPEHWLTHTYCNTVQGGIGHIAGKSRMNQFIKYIAESMRHSRTKFLLRNVELLYLGCVTEYCICMATPQIRI